MDQRVHTHMTHTLGRLTSCLLILTQNLPTNARVPEMHVHQQQRSHLRSVNLLTMRSCGDRSAPCLSYNMSAHKKDCSRKKHLRNILQKNLQTISPKSFLLRKFSKEERTNK